MKPKPTLCKWCGREILPRYLCGCPSGMKDNRYKVTTATGWKWTQPGGGKDER